MSKVGKVVVTLSTGEGIPLSVAPQKRLDMRWLSAV